MSYRLDLERPAGEEVRRCAREQLDRAARRLADPGGDRVAAVHDARKAIKKTRALLRLVRPAVPGAVRRAEDAQLRETARALAAVREADVLPAVVADLAERFAGRLPAVAFTELEAELEATAGPAGDAGAAVAQGLDGLRAAAERAGAWPLDGCDGATLVAGAALAYRRGMKARRVARRTHDAEALHAWRKRVKDRWYHDRLLRDLWPEALRASAREGERLADALGADHDLAVLQVRLGQLDPARLRAAEPAAFEALVAERRAALQDEAERCARRLYAESPAAFEQRLGRWMVARVQEPPPGNA